MNHILEHRSIDNESIILDNSVVHFLGPKLTLTTCTVDLRLSGRQLAIVEAELVDCHIKVRRTLKNFPWCDASLRGCRFTGTLSGHDFGHWPDLYAPNGGIRDCDFSAAILDGCRFIECDIDSITLPTWPCFTIINPIARAADMLAIQWPGRLGILGEIYADSPPPGIVAVTHHAPTLVKGLGGTEEELKKALDSLGDVTY